MSSLPWQTAASGATLGDIRRAGHRGYLPPSAQKVGDHFRTLRGAKNIAGTRNRTSRESRGDTPDCRGHERALESSARFGPWLPDAGAKHTDALSGRVATPAVGDTG